MLDAAAGLTVGTVDVVDAQRLLVGRQGASSPQPPPGVVGTAGATGSATGGSAPGEGRAGPSRAALDSGPAPLMGGSTLDQSAHAPAGVAGAVGGFMLAAAVVCAILALVLGAAWLLVTVSLAIGGALAIRLAGDWLGHV